MNTNDVIIGITDRGSFHFPIEFEMFNNPQRIEIATFDTGCSHSLISAKNLELGEKSLDEWKINALFNPNVMLSIGKGIESKDIDITQLKSEVQKINKYKRKVKSDKISEDEASKYLTEHISYDMQSRILKSKLIRYEYKAKHYKIDGIEIGDFNIKVSFDLTNSNLIGMHIIKELYTKIFSVQGQVFLLAKKNTVLADAELDVTMDSLRKELEL